MSHSNTLLHEALAAAGRGWPVFLLGRSKRPLANCPQCPKRGRPGAHGPETCAHLTCHGFYAATTDTDRIEAMIAAHPHGLLAVRTGATPAGAGVVVIDIDPAHGGRYDRDLMVPTLCTATGNYGWHLFYRHPAEPILSRPLPGRDGVDVKADGGYVVLPPSIHPITRRPYRWAAELDIEEMPARLAATVQTPAAASGSTPTVLRQPQRSGASSNQDKTIRHPERFIESCLAAVRRAPEGRRRVTLYGAARGVARVIQEGHITVETGITQLTDVGRDADQTDRDIAAAITAAFTAEGLTPRGIDR